MKLSREFCYLVPSTQHLVLPLRSVRSSNLFCGLVFWGRSNVRPPFNLVGYAERWTNTVKYLHSFPFLSRPFSTNYQNLRKMYIDDGFSAKQVAEKLGISKSTALKQIHKSGLKKSSKKEA